MSVRVPQSGAKAQAATVAGSSGPVAALDIPRLRVPCSGTGGTWPWLSPVGGDAGLGCTVCAFAVYTQHTVVTYHP